MHQLVSVHWSVSSHNTFRHPICAIIGDSLMFLAKNIERVLIDGVYRGSKRVGLDTDE